MTPTPTTVARPDPRAVAQRAALVPLIAHFRAGPPPRVWQL